MTTRFGAGKRKTVTEAKPALPAEFISVTDLEAIGDLARQKILKALPEILDGLIAKARGGSYLHANFLFAFAGLDEMEDEEESESGGSLAELLLSKLEGGEAAAPPGGPELFARS